MIMLVRTYRSRAAATRSGTLPSGFIPFLWWQIKTAFFVPGRAPFVGSSLNLPEHLRWSCTGTTIML